MWLRWSKLSFILSVIDYSAFLHRDRLSRGEKGNLPGWWRLLFNVWKQTGLVINKEGMYEPPPPPLSLYEQHNNRTPGWFKNMYFFGDLIMKSPKLYFHLVFYLIWTLQHKRIYKDGQIWLQSIQVMSECAFSSFSDILYVLEHPHTLQTRLSLTFHKGAWSIYSLIDSLIGCYSFIYQICLHARED